MRIQANRHVLVVPDIAKTSAFFVRGLGFREVFNDGFWSFVKRDNCMIMLGQCPDQLPAGELGDHQYFAYLVVDDADSYYAQRLAAEVEISSPISDKPWMMRELGVRTPDGHRLTIGRDLEPL